MRVRLSDFNENWARMFQMEAQYLKAIFGDEIIRFEHFGSTSVYGLKAKPVIDMMCIVKDVNERHLIFRDYLRTHPEEVEKYSRFKEELAKRFDHTNEYSPAKKTFVKEMEQEALHWYAERQRKLHLD